MYSLDELYEKYHRALYRFLLSLTGSEYNAEELLQEVFYQALIRVDKFEGRCSPLTWLCQIGKKLWFKELEKNNRYHYQAIEELKLADNRAVLEKIEEIEDKKRLRKAICELKEPYREVVVLHIYGERSLKDIAASFGKTESWARVTFYRAKQMLREQMRIGG